MAEQAVRKPQRKGPALENVSSRAGLFCLEAGSTGSLRQQGNGGG